MKILSYLTTKVILNTIRVYTCIISYDLQRKRKNKLDS